MNAMHRGMSSFRQVVRPATEGLHISIRPDGFATLHRDTTSPVTLRRENGSCGYTLGLVIEHGIRDLGHYRGPLPTAPGPGETPF